jgi:very-long-chain enoyl-CoA reductase
MTSLTIAANGRSTLFQDFPISLKLSKSVDVATVADVKAALAAKLPRVRSSWALHASLS